MYGFDIDTQPQFPYTPHHKKGIIINNDRRRSQVQGSRFRVIFRDIVHGRNRFCPKFLPLSRSREQTKPSLSGRRPCEIVPGTTAMPQYRREERKDYISPRLNRLRISQGRQSPQRPQRFKKIIRYFFSVLPVIPTCRTAGRSMREITPATRRVY